MSLAVCDPGKNVAGLAVFTDGLLSRATLIRAKGAYEVALYAAEWFGDVEFEQLVTEGQQIYAGPRRNNPNDLLFLAQVVGGVQARVAARERYVVLPRVWTRGTPKEIRLARAEAALSPEEARVLAAVKCPKSLRHNVVDAVALGRWFLNQRSSR